MCFYHMPGDEHLVLNTYTVHICACVCVTIKPEEDNDTIGLAREYVLTCHSTYFAARYEILTQ